MGEFFRGWRRKIGVMTLLMACVFAAGWVRSGFCGDGFDYRTALRVLSLDCMVLISVSRVEQFYWTWPDYWSLPFSQFDLDNTDLKLNLAGILFGVTGDSSHDIVAIPYHWIVIPLTLLSAWLLLSKPRKPNQTKPTESFPERAA